MTDEQFTALTKLTRARPGPSLDAARLALVEGLSVPDAARAAGAEYRAAYAAVKRLKAALLLAVQARAGDAVAAHANIRRAEHSAAVGESAVKVT